jgi:hypothetical protein
VIFALVTLGPVGAGSPTGTVASGMTSFTAGIRRSAVTPAADTCAATALTLTSWTMSVPPLARMAATTGFWSWCAAATRAPAERRRLRLA